MFKDKRSIITAHWFADLPIAFILVLVGSILINAVASPLTYERNIEERDVQHYVENLVRTSLEREIVYRGREYHAWEVLALVEDDIRDASLSGTIPLPPRDDRGGLVSLTARGYYGTYAFPDHLQKLLFGDDHTRYVLDPLSSVRYISRYGMYAQVRYSGEEGMRFSTARPLMSCTDDQSSISRTHSSAKHLDVNVAYTAITGRTIAVHYEICVDLLDLGARV